MQKGLARVALWGVFLGEEGKKTDLAELDQSIVQKQLWLTYVSGLHVPSGF